MSRPVILCVAMLAMGLISSAASAQIIYEPVRYQYTHGGQNTFYYGGCDPGVINYARGPVGGAGWWGRVHGFDFISGDYQTHRDVNGEWYRVYTDAIPFQNARLWGFTDVDARNEAYANHPTYFTKADLLATAYPNGDGSYTVPATPACCGPRYYTTPPCAPANYYGPANGGNGAGAMSNTGKTHSPRPVLIIPKKALDKPLDPPRKLASAERKDTAAQKDAQAQKLASASK